MKIRKAVSSRKQEDSNDNLKSYFLKIRILCEIHRRVCRYTEKFPPFYYLYFITSIILTGKLQLFENHCWCFLKIKPGKEVGIRQIYHRKKRNPQNPFEGNWSFIVRMEFLFISMEHQALRKKSQKPVRLRKTGSICEIIRKMKTAISPV